MVSTPSAKFDPGVLVDELAHLPDPARSRVSFFPTGDDRLVLTQDLAVSSSRFFGSTSSPSRSRLLYVAVRLRLSATPRPELHPRRQGLRPSSPARTRVPRRQAPIFLRLLDNSRGRPECHLQGLQWLRMPTSPQDDSSPTPSCVLASSAACLHHRHQVLPVTTASASVRCISGSARPRTPLSSSCPRGHAQGRPAAPRPRQVCMVCKLHTPAASLSTRRVIRDRLRVHWFLVLDAPMFPSPSPFSSSASAPPLSGAHELDLAVLPPSNTANKFSFIRYLRL
jgi:hypothetical protein